LSSSADADAESSNDLQKMISLQPALRFNGGGHVNHSIFWTNLAPPKEGGGGKPTGELLQAIEASFGSFDKFKDTMSAQSVGVQGSGWGWLGYNKALNRVEILTKPNQDPLTELVPLLGFDVWEHGQWNEVVAGVCRSDARLLCLLFRLLTLPTHPVSSFSLPSLLLRVRSGAR
jgi:superoxide dismutase